MPVPASQRTPISAQKLRERAGRVAVALSGETMFQDAEREASREKAFVEFRLDFHPSPEALLPSLAEFLQRHPHVWAIATCRRRPYGGGFGGSAQQQMAILLGAADAGCRLADIEIETAEELGDSALSSLRTAGAAVILSWHDFAGTPPLQPVLDRMRAFRPELCKIVPTAATLRDSLLLLDLLQSAGEGVVAMAMGQRGVLTRVLGPLFGSVFTFASPDGNPGTAPGQVSASVLRELYRVENITRGTGLYAVAGCPIGASLSPLMHNTAFRAAGLDAVYLPLETDSAAELQEVADRLGLRGLSITMPLKEAVLPLLSHRDPSVLSMGACNTLLRQKDGTLAGFNTDVAGIVDPLERHGALAAKKVLVLGAGGAARAAVFGLRAKGAEVFLLNRTPERAAALGREAGASVLQRDALRESFFDIVINSTPYGMRGKAMEAPVSADEMRCGLFFDLVYNPVETPLMRMAQGLGIPTIAGVEMFVAQGVQQYELWTGASAPREAMLRAVLGALQQPPA